MQNLIVQGVPFRALSTRHWPCRDGRGSGCSCGAGGSALHVMQWALGVIAIGATGCCYGVKNCGLTRSGSIVTLTAYHHRDQLEILKDRHEVRSTLATTQLPIEKWHDSIGDPILANTILDRLVHNAYKINLKGESMRKQKKNVDDPYTDRGIMAKTHVNAPRGWQPSREMGGRVQ